MSESTKRFQGDSTPIWEILLPTVEDPTLVVCPACKGMGKVLPLGTDRFRAKFVCTQCSVVKTNEGQQRSIDLGSQNAPTDGFFQLPLWMQVACCGETLWALNMRHLSLLETFVGAKLRERKKDDKTGWRNASLVSRLPAWMKSAKHRAKILKGLERLRTKSRGKEGL